MKFRPFLLLPFFSSVLHAANVTWNTSGSSDTWDINTTANWTGGATVFNTGDNATFGAAIGESVTVDAGGVAPASTVISGNGSWAFSGGAIGGSGTLAKSGTGSLTLSSANSFSSITVSGGPDSQSSGALSLGNNNALGSGDITFTNTTPITGLYFQSGFGATSTLANNITFTSSAVQTRLLATANMSPTTQTVTLSGKLSGGSSSSPIRVDNTVSSGSAIVKLTNASNDVTVSIWELWRGGLEFTSDAALGNANNDLKLNVAANEDPIGTGLRFGADNITLNSNRAVEIADRTIINTQAFTGSQIDGPVKFTKTIVKKGSTSLTLNGTASGTGGIRIDDGSVQIGTGGTTGAVGTGEIIFNAAGTNLTVNRSNAFSMSNNITGSGSVTKKGAGNLTLSGTNSYSAGTSIEGGSISISAAANIGSGDLNFTAASTGLTITGTAVTLANNFGLGNVSGNISIVTPTNSSTILNGNITGGGANTVWFFQGGGQSQNTGALTLNGINTMEGAINIQRGPLILGNSSAAGSAKIIINSNNNPSGSLQFGSSFSLSNAVNLDGVAEKIGVAGSQVNTLAGVISNGGMEKVGTGTLILSNTNTYSGATKVSNGTLMVTGSIAAGAVTVDSGTLAGDGTIGGSVKVNSAILSLGNGVTRGDLEVIGTIDLSATSTLSLTIDSESSLDRLANTGTFTAGGAILNVTFNDMSVTQGTNVSDLAFASTYTFITGAVDGTSYFGNSTDMDAGDMTIFGLTGTQKEITIGLQRFWLKENSWSLVAISPVPETSTSLLGLASGALLLMRRKRQA